VNIRKALKLLESCDLLVTPSAVPGPFFTFR
jgi:hypothetical protein